MSDQSGAQLNVIPGLPQRLEIVAHIATGAQKRVFRAYDRLRQIDVALYCTRQHNELNSNLDRLQELHALARIRPHPNVLSLLEVLETEESLVLSVPYVAGGDLGVRIANAHPDPLPIRECLQYGLQIADAIAHVHRHGIIHGDIKASNVLLGDNDTALLADFGFSDSAGIHGETNSVFGTLTHLAPEQIRGEKAAEQSDLYSFGCLLYQLMCGRTPFSAHNAAQLLHLQLTAIPRAARNWNPEIPKSISRLIGRLLEKQPGSRPQSAREVRSVLAAGLRMLSYCATETVRHGPLPSRRDTDERLDQLVTEAASGEPRLVLLTGELGSGRSETLRRIAMRALEKEFVVSIGLPGNRPGIPYSPMISALAELSAYLVELDVDTASHLRTFLYLADQTENEATYEGCLTQDRLFAAILMGLETISRRRPILLILEDIDLFDDSSLALIAYLEFAVNARAKGDPMRLVLVASCQKDTIPERLAPFIDQNELAWCTVRVDLDCLEWHDISRLAKSLGLISCDRPLAERVLAMSRGNILVAVEALHRLTRMTPVESGEWLSRFLPEHSEGCPSFYSRQLLQDRLDACSQPCRTALEIGSVLGLEFSMKIVRSVASAIGIDLTSGLNEACEMGFLVDRGDVLAFTHPLAREILTQRLSQERTSSIRLECINALRSSSSESPEIRDMEVARHLLAAGTKAQGLDVTECIIRAGRHAMSRFAWADAVRFFDGALKTLDEDSADDVRAHLHHQLGLAYFRLFDAEPSLHHLEYAIAIATRFGDRIHLARFLIDRARAINRMGLSGGCEFQRSCDDLRLILPSVPSTERAVRAGILAALAESAWVANDAEEAESLCMDALDATSAEIDDTLRADISVILGLAQLSLLKHQDALATWHVGALHGRRGKAVAMTARCLQRAQLALFVSGRLRDAGQLSRELGLLNRIVHMPAELALASAINAAIAAVQANFDVAEAEFSSCTMQLSRAQYPWGLAMITPTIACARAIVGNAAGAWAALEALENHHSTVKSQNEIARIVDRHRALVNYFVGEPVTIPRGFRESLESHLSSPRPDQVTVYQACVALEIAAAQQDGELARRALPIVEEAVELGWVFTTGWPFFLPRLVGAGRMLIGDVDVAIRRLKDVLERPLVDKLPIESGRVRYDLARALMLSLDSTARDDARAIAVEAANVLEVFPRCVFHDRALGLVQYIDSID